MAIEIAAACAAEPEDADGLLRARHELFGGRGRGGRSDRGAQVVQHRRHARPRRRRAAAPRNRRADGRRRDRLRPARGARLAQEPSAGTVRRRSPSAPRLDLSGSDEARERVAQRRDRRSPNRRAWADGTAAPADTRGCARRLASSASPARTAAAPRRRAPGAPARCTTEVSTAIVRSAEREHSGRCRPCRTIRRRDG